MSIHNNVYTPDKARTKHCKTAENKTTDAEVKCIAEECSHWVWWEEDKGYCGLNNIK